MIQLPDNNLPIAVLVSGGADSAILLYLIALQVDVPIFAFTLSSKSKGHANITAATEVVRYVTEKTNAQIIHNIEQCDDQNNSILFRPVDYLFDEGMIGSRYTGLTKNPPDDIATKFNGGNIVVSNTDHERNPNIIRTVIHDRGWMTPFTNMDKKDIAELYQKYDVMDLFELTRSCEYIVKDNERIPSHCGECWWCNERMWAFGKL